MEQIERFARQISELMERGLTPHRFHGGGPEITEEMKRAGWRSRRWPGCA
jgi:acetylglutamate kinase